MAYDISRSEENSLRYNGFAEDRPLPVVSILNCHSYFCFSESVQKQLRRRGVKVLTGLGRLFRSHDRSGDGRLNKYELEKALIDYHIDVDQDVSIKTTYIITTSFKTTLLHRL